jgi:hypothetical protein
MTSITVFAEELDSDTSQDDIATGTFQSGKGEQASAGTSEGQMFETKKFVGTLLVAEAAGPGIAMEVSGSNDDIQIQFPMHIVGGEVFDGASGGLVMLKKFHRDLYCC